MKFTLKRLNDFNRPQVLEHFLRLDKESRSSRFCTAITDESMSNYVKKTDFKNGIFGIFNEDLEVIGLGECVFFKEKDKLTAEVAFTIEKNYQGNGLGNKLMKRVVQYANSQNINELHMYCIKSNQAIVHLAKKYNLVPQYDGTEISGVVKTPDVLPFVSNINETFEDGVATFELVISFHKKVIKDHIEQYDKHKQLFKKMFQI